MAVVLCTTGETSKRIQFTLSSESQFFESVAQLEAFLLDNPDEELVIIGPEIDLLTATKLAERFRIDRPSLGVLLTRRRVDVSTLNKAIRSGIREVINIDESAELLKAVKRSQSLSNQIIGSGDDTAINKFGKTILVFSAKGGCGKTTLSTNLAESLAATSGGTVCLVDFDLQFGDIGVALRINPGKSISNAVDMKDHLDKQALSSLVVNYKPNFDVLLAPANPVDAEYVTGELCRQVLTQLREMYNYIVIDSSPAFTDVILEAFDIADHHLLLTTLDVPTLKNLRVSTNTLDELGLPAIKRIFIVNQSDINVGLTVKDVERSIETSVGIQIPASHAVPMSVNRGVTLFAFDPKHPVSKAIQSIANLFIEQKVSHRKRTTKFRRRNSQ